MLFWGGLQKTALLLVFVLLLARTAYSDNTLKGGRVNTGSYLQRQPRGEASSEVPTLALATFLFIAQRDAHFGYSADLTKWLPPTGV